MPKEIAFKCPCDGENSECIHCQGTGFTNRQIIVRSQRTLSINSTSTTTPYKSNRERLLNQQIANQIHHLRTKFINQKDDKPTIFIRYLNQIAFSLECHFICFRYPNFFLNYNLKELPQILERLKKTNENERILADAIELAINTFQSLQKPIKKTKKSKQSITKQKVYPPENFKSEAAKKWFLCKHCNRKIFNQEQHNYLFHPAEIINNKAQPTDKKNKQKTKILSDTDKNSKNLKNLEAINNKKHSAQKTKSDRQTIENSHHTRQHDSIDQRNADQLERALDGLRNWGGTFRDNNGTFGSYPLHDAMDEESNA